jgi:hypothetical protein
MDPVLRIVERSNQRGGRMLSVVDLLRAGTLNRRQAAWLLARIEQGASWMVGARPGGAGKTTVMSALLAMLPAGERVRLTNPGSGWEMSRPGECIVAYEISRGYYDAYIWGADLAHMAALGACGCRLVTNLHADTLVEAREQIVRENGVPAEGFDAFGMFLPLAVRRRGLAVERVIPAIHYYRDGGWQVLDESEPPSEREEQIDAFLDDCARRELVTVCDVRKAWLEWQVAHPIG